VRVVLLIARARLRRNVGATLALILLAGVGGGLVLASLASIRRADSGWAALRADNPPVDAVGTLLTEEHQLPSPTIDDLAGFQAAVEERPEVTDTMRLTTVVADVSAPQGQPQRVVGQVAIDPPLASVLGDPIVVAGRSADTTRADETMIDEDLAASLGVSVGDVLTVTPVTTDQLDAVEAGATVRASGTPTQVRVVGMPAGWATSWARGTSSRAWTTPRCG
jgi:ABC-type lipoprotein release transport system permease subunit